MNEATRRMISELIAAEEQTRVAPWALDRQRLAEAALKALANGDVEAAGVLAQLHLGAAVNVLREVVSTGVNSMRAY
jgi:hypothetical protein